MAVPVVGVLVGSPIDQKVMDEACVILEKFGIAYELEVMSAHRDPGRVARYACEAESRGLEVVIAGDSRAAHLPGAVAAYTVLPVIGVPISSSPLGGTDALYCIVQMPKGVPVATVAVDGAANAAVLAAQILSVGDLDLREMLRDFKQQLAEGSRL
ncbi:MAG: 5-(carboxyamino)imidazole ribonucleotide mutase [Egibacteraceae bacterium]